MCFSSSYWALGSFKNFGATNLVIQRLPTYIQNQLDQAQNISKGLSLSVHLRKVGPKWGTLVDFGLVTRVRTRFFDQLGHKTMYASS